MSLTLDLPVIENNPVLLAEVRPNKIAEFIEKIPFNNIFSAATVLLEEMQILNRQKVSADSRIKALELYRPVLIRITSELSTYYVNNSIMPMPAKVKSCASAAELLWMELGYGYKLAWSDINSKRLNLTADKASALVLQRAIDSLSQLSLVYYNLYFTLPASIWSDLHHLYFSAAQQNLENIEVTDSHSKSGSSTINSAYIHALLVSLADPQHLAKSDIQRASDYLSNLAKLGLIRGIGALESPSGIFVIKLDSSQAPIPFTKSTSEPNSSNDILLVTLDIARKMHQHLKTLQDNKVPSDGNLRADALESHDEDLLIHLIKHLGITPRRLFSRANKNHKVELAIGIAEMDQLFNPAAKSIAKPSVWQVQNTSATGFALRKFQPGEISIKVGDFVAMKESAESAWSIMVLRWLIADEQNQIDIGLQLLAPSVNVVGIKSLKLASFEKALILPEISPLKQPMTIVTSRGMYSPAEVFDLSQNGTTSQVLATKLLERTAGFERFQFSLI